MSPFNLLNTVLSAIDLASSGKYYVVIVCVLLIFIGLAIALIRVDRKVSKLESVNKYNETVSTEQSKIV